MTSKYLNLTLIFCQPQKNCLTTIDIGIFRIKKMISCIQAVCVMDIVYPWKNRKFLQAIVVTKMKEAFSSEQCCGSTKSSFFMKYKINIIDTFAIIFFNISNPYYELLLQRSSICISHGPEHL